MLAVNMFAASVNMRAASVNMRAVNMLGVESSCSAVPQSTSSCSTQSFSQTTAAISDCRSVDSHTRLVHRESCLRSCCSSGVASVSQHCDSASEQHILDLQPNNSRRSAPGTFLTCNLTTAGAQLPVHSWSTIQQQQAWSYSPHLLGSSCTPPGLLSASPSCLR